MTSFDEIWAQFDQELPRPVCDTPGCGKEIPIGGEGYPEVCPDCIDADVPIEFLGVINMPGHALDGCRGKLVELLAESVNGVTRHSVVVELLEKRGIFNPGHEVTVDCSEWREIK